MDSQPQILLIEDEEDIAEFLSLELQHEGYATTIIGDGRDGLTAALESEWAVILLDIMLPGLNGLEVCRRIRAVSLVPIIMLTARDTVPDRVAGLDGGADDYLAKPFAIEELLARIRVLRRRNTLQLVVETLTADNLMMNLATREVSRDEQVISLTAREFELLEYFMRNPNHVLSRDQLIKQVWGYDYVGETNIVDVYIRYLRNKIDTAEKSPLVTVRGFGYMLKV